MIERIIAYMVFFRNIFHPQEHQNLEKTDCNRCTYKICCSVFDILEERNQGREIHTIKEAGILCPHLHEHACSIYHEREDHPGFSQCEFFSCHNTGPILGDWLDNNKIAFDNDPRLGHILRYLMQKRETGKSGIDIAKYLKQYTSIEDLSHSIFSEKRTHA